MAKNVQRINEMQSEQDVILSRDKIRLDQPYVFDNPLDLVTLQEVQALIDNLGDLGLPSSPAGAVADWNAPPYEGLLHGDTTALNGPVASSVFTGFNLQGEKVADHDNIIGVDRTTKDWYTRVETAGAWAPWRKIYTDGNLNPTRAALYSGNVDFNALSPYQHLYAVQQGAAKTNVPTTVDLPVIGAHYHYDSNFAAQSAFTAGSIGAVDFKVRNKIGGAWSGWYTVWHANNANKSSVDWNAKGFISNFPLALKMLGGFGIVSCWNAAGTTRHGFIQLDADRVILTQDTGQKVIQLGLNITEKVGICTAGPSEMLEVYLGNSYVNGGRSIAYKDSIPYDNQLFKNGHFEARTYDSYPSYGFHITDISGLALYHKGQGNGFNDLLRVRNFNGEDFHLWHSGNLDPASVGGNFVTLDTAQTITGAKTFQTHLRLNGYLISNGDKWYTYGDVGGTTVKDYGIYNVDIGADAFVIQRTTNNVGIGVTPTAKLHVVSVSPETTLRAEGPNGNIVINHNNTGKNYYNANTSHEFQGGNVGIGTETPTEKLHVGGNIRVNTLFTTPQNPVDNIANLIAAPHPVNLGYIGVTAGVESFVQGIVQQSVTNGTGYILNTSIGHYRSGVADFGALYIAVGATDAGVNRFYQFHNDGNIYFRDRSGAELVNKFWHSGANNTTGGTVTAAQFHTNGWFRNTAAAYGLYNEATQAMWYSGGVTDYTIEVNAAYANIEFKTAGNIKRGYLHCSNQEEMGFLNAAGGWKLRCDISGNTTATEFYRTSSRKEKRNIKPYRGRALDILLGTEIKTYRKKADNSQGLGFIAEETDPLLSGPDRTAHNFGAHLALLTKAVQELKAEIDTLKTARHA